MKMFDNWRRKKGEAVVALPPAETPAPVAEVAPSVDDRESVTLELGDFLHRIPVGLLKESAPDPKRTVQVELGEIAQCITTGRSTTTLERLFRKTPGLFRPDAPPLDGVEIYYPWQKILRLVTQPALGEGPGVSVQHLLAKMKKCTAAKTAQATAGDQPAPRGAVQRMRDAGRQVSWMSVQETRRAAPAAVPAASPLPVEPEAAREIPMRVETTPPTVLRMPDLSMKAAVPTEAAPPLSVIPDLAPAPELKLAMMPDLALAEDVPAAVPALPSAMAIPDLALADEDAAPPMTMGVAEAAPRMELEPEALATIHFPQLSKTMPDLALAEDEPAPAAVKPDLAEVCAEVVTAANTDAVGADSRHDSEMAEVRRAYDGKIAALEAAQKSAAAQAEEKSRALAETERRLAAAHSERERELAALREQQAETEKRHAEERAALERKVAEFIALGDSAVSERDAQIAAQREEIMTAAKAREEILAQERARAEAATEAARAESLAIIEQVKSAASLEADRMRAELQAAQDELLAASASRDAEQAMAEGELAERDQQLEWKNRAIEGLEGDVETYRKRIKAVLKERDDLAEEKKRLELQLRALQERRSTLAEPAGLQA